MEKAFSILLFLCVGIGLNKVWAQGVDSLITELQKAEAEHVDLVEAKAFHLLSTFTTARERNNKVLVLCYLSDAYVLSGRYREADSLLELTEGLFSANTRYQAMTLRSKAKLNYRLPNTDLANSYLEQSLSLFDSLGLIRQRLETALCNIGPLKASNAQLAMEKVLDGLEQLKSMDAPGLQHKYLFELAHLNEKLDNKAEAQRIIDELLPKLETSKENYLKCYLLSLGANMAPTKDRRSLFEGLTTDFHHLKDYYNESLAYMRMSLSDIAESSDEAMYFLNKASHLSDSLDMQVPQLSLFKSWHHASNGQFAIGLALAHKTYRMAPRWGRKRNAYQATYNLAKFHAEMGQFDSAYFYQELATKIQAEITPKESAILAGRMQVKMATEALLKEKEQLARQQVVLHESELNQQKWVRNVWIAASIFLVAILVLIVRNYFRQKRSKALVESQKLGLERLDRLNREVFSVIAHDFKGPLITMEILADTLPTAQQSQQSLSLYQNDLKSQIHQTRNMLENLLNWARAELALEPKVEPSCKPHNICEEILHDMGSIAKEKRVVVLNQLPDKITAPIRADVLRIVWRNLIGNAIKFSEPSQKVEIGYEEKGNTFFVKDEGVGMSDDLQGQLFDQSVASEPGTKFETGFGLGLFISHELLHKSGWWIKANSVLNQGSTFQFGPQKLSA